MVCPMLSGVSRLWAAYIVYILLNMLPVIMCNHRLTLMHASMTAVAGRKKCAFTAHVS